MRTLSSLEAGFSRSSWFTSGSKEYPMSEVAGWAWVKTTVSAITKLSTSICSEMHATYLLWQGQEDCLGLLPLKERGTENKRSRLNEIPLRLTTNRSYTSTALCDAVATGYSCISAKELIGRFSSNVDGTTSGCKPCKFCQSLYGKYDSTLHTRVRRISSLRGLEDANIIRFPDNFFVSGILRAVGRTWFGLEAIC